MAANITLSEIIAIKGGTIEELCQYAKSKGITIPNSLDYQLSPSELKAIDPMLAFKLKYKRDVTSQEKGEEKGIVANQNKLEITKEHRDDSETEELKTKKKKIPSAS